MAELADALDLGSSVERREGSSPSARTKFLWGSTLLAQSSICGIVSLEEHTLSIAKSRIDLCMTTHK